jgi:hypothetical protein
MRRTCERTDCPGPVVGTRPVYMFGSYPGAHPIEVPLCREHYDEWDRPVVSLYIGCEVAGISASGRWTRPRKRWTLDRSTSHQGRETTETLGRFATCAEAEALKSRLESANPGGHP